MRDLKPLRRKGIQAFEVPRCTRSDNTYKDY